HVLSRPTPGPQQTHGFDWVEQQGAEKISEPEPDALNARPAIGHHGGEQTHGVRATGITYCFDVCVFIDVDAGADGDALRKILAASRHARADERFRVGPNMFPQATADGR